MYVCMYVCMYRFMICNFVNSTFSAYSRTKQSLRSVCFTRKHYVKIVFHIFQCLVVQKKPGQWKIIFGQQKTLIKIRLIFYSLFSKIFFWKTISLSHVASPINIIFVYSRGKDNFLAPSLSHSKFSHIFSLPFTFSLLTPSLSLTLVSPLPIDLSLCLCSLFSPCFSSPL